MLVVTPATILHLRTPFFISIARLSINIPKPVNLNK